jgi:hypothetical protein
MADIFLSYRRQDSQSATGRLADRLEARFGRTRVFHDHESIVAGEDFDAIIRRRVEASTVLLVIVGPRWLGATDATGRRRLDDPHDYVRLEIELALRADVAVVPVLVEGATMPQAAGLPPSLAAFARCQAVELSETRWRYDADQLVATLQSRFAIESETPPPGADADDAGDGRIARIASDLLDLAVHPRRLIARRQTGRARDHVRAFAFLVVAVLAGNASFFALDVHVVHGTGPGAATAAVAGWLLTAVLMHLLVAALLAAALAIAWRLVGGEAAHRRVGIVAAYVYGGTWLGLCAGALLAGTGAQLLDPGLFERLTDALRAAAGGASVDQLPHVRKTGSPQLRGVVYVLVLLGGIVHVATAAWLIAAWGAFRQAFAASRIRAAAATLIWLGIVGTVLGVGLWAGKP